MRAQGLGLLLAVAAALNCSPKEKIVTETKYVDREVIKEVFVQCDDENPCDESEKDTNSASSSDGDGSGSNSTVSDLPQLGSSSDSSGTSVSVAGSLAITTDTSSGGSLSLRKKWQSPYHPRYRSAQRNSSEATWYLKCVTLDLTDISSCIGKVGTDKSFNLACDGFKGKQFGCFILQSSDGTANEESLTIAGTLSSDDLVIGDETTNVDMSITFDPSTGASELKGLSQKIVSGDDEIAVDASSIKKTVSTALQNLDIETGNYEFCYSWLDNKHNAQQGKFDDFSIEYCPGHKETSFIKFKKATSETPPKLEIWNKQADYDACTTSTGEIQYHISDGTNTLQFTPKTASFDDLLQAVVAYEWAPSVTLELYLASKVSSAKEQDPVVDQLKSIYPENQYPDGICEPFIGDLVTGYQGAVLVKENGYSHCEYGSVTYPQALQNLFADDPMGGPPPHWCDMYRSAPDDEGRSEAQAMMLGECIAHLEGGSQDIWGARDLVNGLLHTLGEARHQNNNQRGEEVKSALNDFLSAISGVADTDSSGTGGEIADLDATVFDAVDTFDSEAEALAQAWAEIEWEFQLRETLDCIAKDITAAAGTCESIYGPPKPTRELFRILLQGPNPFCPGCGANSGEEWLQQEICMSSGDGQMDLSKVDVSAGSVLSNFMDNVDFGDFGPSFAQSVSHNDKKTLWDTLIDGLIANKEIVGCEASQLLQTKQMIGDHYAIPNSESLAQNPADDNLHHWGWQFNEHMLSAALFGINTKIPNGNGAENPFADGLSDTQRDTYAEAQVDDLVSDIFDLFDRFPRNFSWVIETVCWADWTGSLAALGNTYSGQPLACGSPIPDDLKPFFFFCMDDPSCSLPTPDTNADRNNGDWPKYDRYAQIVHSINQERSWNAFRADTAFKTKKKQLISESQCLPDMSLGHNPIVEAGELTFDLSIRSPVKRRLAGNVNLDLSYDSSASSTPRYSVSVSRLETHEGGMGSEDCYWGEVQKMHKITHDASTDSLGGVFSRAWVDTCSGQGESGEDNGWHEAFKAKLNE